jgi:hypothetical protein
MMVSGGFLRFALARDPHCRWRDTMPARRQRRDARCRAQLVDAAPG